jgi:hypothetical protein
MLAWMLDTVALIDYYHGRPGVLPYLDAILAVIAAAELWLHVVDAQHPRPEGACRHAGRRASTPGRPEAECEACWLFLSSRDIACATAIDTRPWSGRG